MNLSAISSTATPYLQPATHAGKSASVPAQSAPAAFPTDTVSFSHTAKAAGAGDVDHDGDSR